MMFLNNITKGGGTKFLFQDYIAQPKAGDFYIWPAGWTHFHQGIKAPTEKKYIITGWFSYDDRWKEKLSAEEREVYEKHNKERIENEYKKLFPK